jgi:hypothetical protein
VISGFVLVEILFGYSTIVCVLDAIVCSAECPATLSRRLLAYIAADFCCGMWLWRYVGVYRSWNELLPCSRTLTSDEHAALLFQWSEHADRVPRTEVERRSCVSAHAKVKPSRTQSTAKTPVQVLKCEECLWVTGRVVHRHAGEYVPCAEVIMLCRPYFSFVEWTHGAFRILLKQSFAPIVAAFGGLNLSSMTEKWVNNQVCKPLARIAVLLLKKSERSRPLR